MVRSPRTFHGLRRQRLPALLAAFAAGGGACADELGDCDMKQAEQVVYGRSGLAATKGQALVHDSCGQAAFCHSASAQGEARAGTPSGLDFDMLPQPDGLGKVLSHRTEIWRQVVDGEMPPDDYTPGDGEWYFDITRKGQKLPRLASDDGKGILRNWLACGAPVVLDSSLSRSADPATVDGSEREWTNLHRALQRGCVVQGCHDGTLSDEERKSGALSVPLVAEECIVYRWLMFNRDACGNRLVVGGDLDASSLIAKVTANQPACGGPMPPSGKVNSKLVAQIQDWVLHGAYAPQCGAWSDEAPRTGGLDGGAGAPDWNRVYSEVIAPGCATANCHDSAGAAKSGDLDLSDPCGSLQALLEEKGPCGEVRVIPGDERSLLVRKLENGTQSCGTAMPPPYGGLPASQINMVREWVLASAPKPDECK